MNWPSCTRPSMKDAHRSCRNCRRASAITRNGITRGYRVPQYAAQRSYWRESLALGRDAPRFPHDKLVSYGTTGRSRVEPIVLDHALADALRRQAQRHDATLFMALLAVLYVVLHHRVGCGELVVGTPVRGRNHADVENLMGFFTSLLPLRAALDTEAPFSDLLAQVRSVVLEGFSHPDVLLEDVLPRRPVAAGRVETSTTRCSPTRTRAAALQPGATCSASGCRCIRRQRPKTSGSGSSRMSGRCGARSSTTTTCCSHPRCRTCSGGSWPLRESWRKAHDRDRRVAGEAGRTGPPAGCAHRSAVGDGSRDDRPRSHAGLASRTVAGGPVRRAVRDR